MSTKLFLLFVLFLLLILALRILTFKETIYKAREELIIEETLLSEPRVKGSTQQFWVGNRGILVIAPRFPQYHYGEKLMLNSTLQERVIDKNNSILIAYFPKIEAAEKSTNALLAISQFIRQKVRSLFNASLPPTSSSLLSGIIFGVRGDMPQDFFESLKKTGTLHVIAASGMNVSLVGSFLASFLILFVRRQIALFITIVGIFFYALLAGFEPSIVRAAIMGSIAFAAQIMGRQNLSLFSLFIAGFIMLMVSPQSLYDIGFQLSFLATLGLITVKPIFDSALSRINLPNFLGFLHESFSTSLAAQIGTLPVLVANFGTFSLISILANTLILWTVPPVMIIGFVAALLGFITSDLAGFLLQFSLPFLMLFESVVRLFGAVPIAVAVGEVPFILSLGYYCLLVSAVLFIREMHYERK